MVPFAGTLQLMHRDGSANCTLPPAAASVLDANLERARNRCLQESKAAAQ